MTNAAFSKGTLVLTGVSAIRIIRAQRRKTVSLPWRGLSRVEQRRALAACVPNESHLDLPHLVRLGAWKDDAGEVLTVLTSQVSNRRWGGAVRSIVVSSSLPPRSIMLVEPSLGVVSPSLLPLHLAGELSDIELIMLMTELTSDYSLSDTCSSFPPFSYPDNEAFKELKSGVAVSYLERSAVCTVNDIGSAMRAMKGIKNAAKMLGLSRHLIGGARSPMEGIMFNAFAFPLKMGGFACGPLLPNFRIDYSYKAARIAGMPYIIADAYLPQARAVLEYNGGDHDDAARRIRDEHRNMALEHMGIRVFTINRETIKNAEALERIAAEIYKRQGKRYRNRVSGFYGRHLEMMNEMRRCCGLKAV